MSVYLYELASGEVNGSAQLRWLVTNVTGLSKGAVFINQKMYAMLSFIKLKDCCSF